MPAPWRTRRRERYGPRQHDAHSQRERGLVVEPVAVVPDEIAWKIRPGDDEAHAYATGPGWMRSACRRERWDVLWQDAPEDAARCFECADLIAGEITESELHAMDGNR